MSSYTRTIPLYTLEGVPHAEISTHPFSTADQLGLSLLRFQRAPSDDVVLIIHGLTTSTDMFIMPEHDNLVTYLLDHGFGDVWSLDFRMSNRHSYNLFPHRYNLDDVALYDYPAALATLRAAVGDRRIHVICHCLGAASFTMSLFGKAISGITSVIANSVALTPRVPTWSRIKLAFAPFFLFQDARDITTPVLFMTGANNNVFADSNIVCYKRLQKLVPGRHELAIFPGYGHQDVFMGKNVAVDIFPRLLQFLHKHRAAALGTTAPPVASRVSVEAVARSAG